MFNRSEIMKAAWANFRGSQAYQAASAYGHLSPAVTFADCLKDEWRRARGAARAARLKANPTYQALHLAYDASLVRGGHSAAAAALYRFEKEFA